MPPASDRRRGRAALALVATALTSLGAGAARADDQGAAPDDLADHALAAYFTELGKANLVDTESGSKDTLTRELGAAEHLLRDGAAIDAAVALYAIVYSPRYAPFHDFVEYQNAEYYLGVALIDAGAYGAALDQLIRVLGRGPAAPYWGPAHRRAVDVALETRDFAGVLARVEAVKSNDSIPPSAAGERAYLRGRAAYEAGQLDAAEGQLVTIGKKSRLYSSALYLRGIIRARRGEYRDAAEAMCQVAGTGDSDRLTFVVDGRYFTIKDLARLGLARIAHEEGEYDDAYYHYFQIPEDSDRLPDALFEASWSMYQKRELPTARDLAAEFLKEYPSSPMWPEASLLAGYVELADCKFDGAQAWYDKLTVKLQPIVDELDRVRKDPDRRRRLFERALGRMQADHAGTGDNGKGAVAADDLDGQVLALLKLDPAYVRLHDAVAGMAKVTGEAPGTVRAWQSLARKVATTKVAAGAGTTTGAEDDLADASALVEDLRRLGKEVAKAKDELDIARGSGALPADVATEEAARLDGLAMKVETALGQAERQAETAAGAITARAAPALQPMLARDVGDARRLDRAAVELEGKLGAAADKLAQRALDRLYTDTRRVLDKAKLGKIDAVIGQKRALDIEVSDLAAGRFPAELHGRLWEEGLIGDDEEFWPFEGEYWKDEYEGFR
jgi:tetratricopeptide (TPR) repeat protein